MFTDNPNEQIQYAIKINSDAIKIVIICVSITIFLKLAVGEVISFFIKYDKKVI